MKIRGVVQLAVVIGTNGEIEEVRVLSGHPLLTSSVLDAVRSWKYQRTLFHGKPTKVLTIVAVSPSF